MEEGSRTDWGMLLDSCMAVNFKGLKIDLSLYTLI
jgi:hypothetical protein